MNKRNAKDLSELLDNKVELTYNNAHSTYTKGQAIIIINDFYNKNRPTAFRIDYKGFAPNRDAQYILGTAITPNGNFKVYLYLSNKSNRYFIQEMKIER